MHFSSRIFPAVHPEMYLAGYFDYRTAVAILDIAVQNNFVVNLAAEIVVNFCVMLTRHLFHPEWAE